MCGWNGVYFSGLPVYEWVSFLHQKYINGVSFSPKKYMNGKNLKNSIWMGSIFKNSIWMGSIFDMGSIWMGHVFHLAWYMNGVGFGDSSRTSVPKITSDPPVHKAYPFYLFELCRTSRYKTASRLKPANLWSGVQKIIFGYYIKDIS